jgi:hypothetical protein
MEEELISIVPCNLSQGERLKLFPSSKEKIPPRDRGGILAILIMVWLSALIVESNFPCAGAPNVPILI